MRYDQQKASNQLFYYCLNSGCHKERPPWTNIGNLTRQNLTNDTNMEETELLSLLGL